MARPKTKSELLEKSATNFNYLLNQIASLSVDLRESEFQPGTMNRNIRDVLGHLHHWHKMMLIWYTEGMDGRMPAMPAQGYSWRTVPDLNRKIHGLYQRVSLLEIEALLKLSHANVHALIEKHSDEELFTKKMYKWTGSTSLGAYLISATSSHYDWAMKMIKKNLVVQ